MKYWNAFLNWSGWRAVARWWTGFTHWSGWSAFVRWDGWRALVSWNGWKKLFRIPPALAALVTAVSAGGLAWVFLTGLDTHPVAYGVYFLSSYALVIVLLGMPALVTGAISLVRRIPFADRLLGDRELRFRLKLYGNELLNFGYGTFKCVAALVYRNAWMGTEGFYNLVQSLIQLVQILKRRKRPGIRQQWESYRLCGWLMFALHLSTTGMAFLILHDHVHKEYPGILIFATAAFTFYKLIRTFIRVARDRRHEAPIDSSVRLLDLSQAIFNLFCLQVALLHAFGGDFALAGLMNTLTGSAVSFLMVAMGFYMLRRSKRELERLSEQEK